MFSAMHAPKRVIWLKIGTWPAFCAALLPVLVALLHLMPAMAAGPVGHSEHHEHAAVAGEGVALQNHCHPPDEPRDDAPQKGMAHCPLCLWLQAFHALPAPLATALPLPSAQPFVVTRREQPVACSSLHVFSQPRAPPISPTV
jgi:hypothetical protein